MDETLRTPLFNVHEAAGARMVDFAGWSMPMLYGSILAEHQATRTDAAVFDVSHMGRLQIRGDRAFRLLDRACTADVLAQEDNTIRYGLLCNAAGGVIDDIMIIRLPDEWHVICNASNRRKVLAHLQRLNEDEGFHADLTDRTIATAMLAVQGPRALAKLEGVLPAEVGRLARHQVDAGAHMMIPYIASRCGYTGEDGLEVILPAAVASQAWTFLTAESGVTPAGLGARDLLRLEAGLPLYGHELNETIDPITAGLERAVRQREGFIGYEAIRAIREKGTPRTLVGLRLETNRIARQGAVVLADGSEIGVVTSGTFSPSCRASIALAFVDRARAAVDTPVRVRLRADHEVDGRVVRRPFYRGSAQARPKPSTDTKPGDA
ncbi:MAG: glycine cleavage system aminomethyltransferase GcvT [Planctomycetes bacterium]|nr:glycine cleavage system aminomethyltransferase GcvT [Planctomycetota bacterium]